MKRATGFYWACSPAHGIGWMPALFYQDEWFMVGFCDPVPEHDLLIGNKVEGMPEPRMVDLKTVHYAGHA